VDLMEIMSLRKCVEVHAPAPVSWCFNEILSRFRDVLFATCQVLRLRAGDSRALLCQPVTRVILSTGMRTGHSALPLRSCRGAHTSFT
jgi:hypothetical protein